MFGHFQVFTDCPQMTFREKKSMCIWFMDICYFGSYPAVKIKHLLCCLILLQWASFEQCIKSIGVQINGSHAFTLYHCYSSLNLFFILRGPVNYGCCICLNFSFNATEQLRQTLQCIFGVRLVHCIVCINVSFVNFNLFFYAYKFQFTCFLLLSLCVYVFASIRYFLSLFRFIWRTK